ncbi:ERF family protein [Lactobacillus sp. ESL0228]|uniref:ERF family protein n=1 Tax=Lactobacillus sp. ESL0228 TaxID=2069352 RepID=UPI000EFA72D8|nr:ERF family protein [Lactobacillus sp. ESL0228]RMC48926.1 replication protein [Lactobacillus sp. ESL0228]
MTEEAIHNTGQSVNNCSFPKIKTVADMKQEEAVKAKKALMKAFGTVQQKIEQPNKGAHGYGYDYTSLDQVFKAIYKATEDEDIAISQLPVIKDGKVGVRNIIFNSQGALIDFGECLLDVGIKKSSGKTQDQGAVLTYARRYSISAIFGIASEEDTDGNGAKQEPQQVQVKTNFIDNEALSKVTVKVGDKKTRLVEVYMLAVSGNQKAEEYIKNECKKSKKFAKYVDAINDAYKLIKSTVDTDTKSKQAERESENTLLNQAVNKVQQDAITDPFANQVGK